MPLPFIGILEMRQFHLMIHQVQGTCSYFHTYGCLHQCQYTMNFVRFLRYFHVLSELFKTSHPFLLHGWSSRRPYSWQIYILKRSDQTSDNHNIKFEIFRTICLNIISSCWGFSFLIVVVGEIWISSMVATSKLFSTAAWSAATTLTLLASFISLSLSVISLFLLFFSS